jgi:predicted lysophospholipase L1 biosynthesis ABC-type transport system permease subunit
VRVAPVIARIGAAVEAAGTALSAASAVTVLAAQAVLAGAVAASYRRRLDEMVTLKVVGARPAQLARAAVLEFALLGSAAAVPAGLLGTAAGYAAVRAISPEAWEFAAAVPLGLGAAAVAVTAGTGWLLARRLLARPSAEALRGLVGG